MKSPMKDFGYDVSDYRDVDPMFGTLADFDALVAEAHRLGLKVIIDQVLSHSSDGHPWFVQSRASRDNPRADWCVWADPRPDGTPPNNWLSVFGGTSWEWDSRRRQYYLHNFLASQPDLNFHNQAVRAALLDDVRFWLDRGVDGFRLDTANFYFHDATLADNPPLPEDARSEVMASRNQPYNWQDHVHDKNRRDVLTFFGELRVLLDEYGAVAVGEVGERIRGAELMGEYTSGSDRPHMCYAFDFLSGRLPGVEDLKRPIERFERAAADGWACWAFSNHDVERHATRWAGEHPDPQAVLQAAAGILMTLRGSVCLYQGEELGLTDAALSYEDLVDPYGIAFWPELKGRRMPHADGLGGRRARGRLHRRPSLASGAGCPSRACGRPATGRSLLAARLLPAAHRLPEAPAGAGEGDDPLPAGTAHGARLRALKRRRGAALPVQPCGGRRGGAAAGGHRGGRSAGAGAVRRRIGGGSGSPGGQRRLRRPARGGVPVAGRKTMANVRLTGVVKAYGAVEVLHGIDLDIRSGEFVVFVGPSGCGKSTLLRVIAGLEDITRGTLEIGGEVVNAKTPKQRGIAMVFQSYALYPHMTAYDNMAFGLKLDGGNSRDAVDRRVREAAQILQIEPYLDRLPKALSGGQRQRVAIGRAITRDPKVFLFDEPLSNLDAALRVQTRIEIARLHERMAGTTMIYVTHDQVEAMTLADRIVVLDKGHVEQVGTPMDLYNHPDNLFVARFLGSPSMNIIDASIASAGAETAVEPTGGRRMTVPVRVPASARGGKAFLGVRPEDLELDDGPEPMFSGPVTLTELLGEVTLIYVDIGRDDDPFVAKLSGEVAIERGTTVGLSARPAALRLFDAEGNAFHGHVTAAAA